eukprot:4585507-Lingulodinium_polyedra.AAC.1
MAPSLAEATEEFEQFNEDEDDVVRKWLGTMPLGYPGGVRMPYLVALAIAERVGAEGYEEAL